MGKRMYERPYAVGFNGHANCCDCNYCTPLRVAAFKKYRKALIQAFLH